MAVALLAMYLQGLRKLCLYLIYLPSCSMKEVTQLIGSLLGGQVRLFTTRCCQQELKALGADFSGTTNSFFHVSLDTAFDNRR